jgi:hypothetical protein
MVEKWPRNFMRIVFGWIGEKLARKAVRDGKMSKELTNEARRVTKFGTGHW